MLIDTHAHLDFPDFEGETEALLERAAAAGVQRVIAIGTSLEGSRRVVALAEAFPSIYAVIGVHPNEAADSLRETPEAISGLRELASHPKVVAIGETGLDYYRLPSLQAKEGPPTPELEAEDRAIQSAQATIFEQQLNLASATGLNVVIHQRGDCLADTLAILDRYAGKVRGVFHCFNGTPGTALQLIERGHLVSFTGIVTFRNAPDVHESARRVPAGSFMVETDCPFLAPVPFRGKRGEPAFTRQVAEKVAELRGEPLESVAETTTRTAEAFFRFDRSVG